MEDERVNQLVGVAFIFGALIGIFISFLLYIIGMVI